jgi:hypothetical protein
MNRSVVQISCPLDLVPANFFIFPKAKPTLKWRFLDIKDNAKNVTTESNALPLDTPLVTMLRDF